MCVGGWGWRGVTCIQRGELYGEAHFTAAMASNRDACFDPPISLLPSGLSSIASDQLNPTRSRGEGKGGFQCNSYKSASGANCVRKRNRLENQPESIQQNEKGPRSNLFGKCHIM